jgi:hypothetical protein
MSFGGSRPRYLAVGFSAERSFSGLTGPLATGPCSMAPPREINSIGTGRWTLAALLVFQRGQSR